MNNSSKSKILIMIFLALALFSSSHVFAAAGEELVFDSWYFESESFFANNKEFTVDISSDKVNIDYDGGYYLLESGDCEIKDITKICFVSKAYDSDEEKDKVNLMVYTVFPVISITRTSDDTSLAVGDDATVTIKISNTGQLSAENILYEEIVPEEAEVTSSDDFEVSGNYISYSGSLEKDDTITLRYDIKAVDTGIMKYKGSLLYDDGFTRKEKSSSSLSITIGSPLTVTATTNSTSSYVEEPIKLNIVIRNPNAQDVDLKNLEIFFPENMIVTMPDSRLVKIDGKRYSWSGLFEKDDEIDLEIVFKGSYEGKQDIIIQGEMEKDSVTTYLEETKRVSIAKRKIVMKTLVIDMDNIDTSSSGVSASSSDEKELESFREYRFLIYLENPYERIDLRNINLTIDSDFIDTEGSSLSLLEKSSSVKIIDMNITAPAVKGKKKHTVTTTVDYSTPYMSYSDEFEDDYSISEIEKVSISKDVSTSNIEEGDEITVTVSLKNNRNIKLEDISVRELLPEGLKTKGATAVMMDLEADQELKAYEYTVQFPYVGEDVKYSLVTEVFYIDPISSSQVMEFNISEDKKVSVDEKKPDINLKKEIDIKEAVAGEIIPVKYTLENDDTRSFRNILIEFPYIEGALYVDSYEYKILSLGEGDTIVIDDAEKIVFPRNRSKKSVSIPETIIYFGDLFGNDFSDDSNKDSLDIVFSSNDLPLLSVDREVAEETKQDSITSKIKIHNQGMSDVSFRLYDFTSENNQKNQITEDTIAPGEIKTYESIIVRDDFGEKEIRSAIAEFEIVPRTYYALSPRYTVEFIEQDNDQSIEDKQDDEPENDSDAESEAGTDNNDNSETEDDSDDETESGSENDFSGEAKKGLIRRLLDFIRSFFTKS